LKNKEVHLKRRNYQSKDWFVTFLRDSENKKDLEFIINAKTHEIAQNALFYVLCAHGLYEGFQIFDNEVHYPHPIGTDFTNIKGQELLNKPIKRSVTPNVLYYFKIAITVSNNTSLINAISKYQLSIDIYSQQDMDIHGVIDWKTTPYNYIQIRFAYAIIAAYSVIEELGLEVRATQENPSRKENGEWNLQVLNELKERLIKNNIHIDSSIPWLIRGEKTELEKNKPIEVIRKTEWADPDNYNDNFFINVNDGYVEICDAISYISLLRSKVSSHRVGERIFNLSLFDVAN